MDYEILFNLKCINDKANIIVLYSVVRIEQPQGFNLYKNGYTKGSSDFCEPQELCWYNYTKLTARHT